MAKHNLLTFYVPIKNTSVSKLPSFFSGTMLVAILIFQMLTCFFIFLNGSWVLWVSGVTFMVICSVIFIILYMFRYKIEDVMKGAFMKQEGCSQIIGKEQSFYQHPMELMKIEEKAP